MTDPYQPPQGFSNVGPGNTTSGGDSLRAPAIALIVVSAIAVCFGALGLVGDFVMIATGAIDELEKANTGSISKHTTILIRVIWGILLLVASSFVLYGATQMLRRKSFGTAQGAAIVAMIPLVGPCCVVGIPFGIWALIELKKPGVRETFR